MIVWPEYWFYHRAFVYAVDTHIAFDGRYGNVRAVNHGPTWRNTIVLPQPQMKGKSYPLKAQRWTRFHWRQWDLLSARERREYEQKVEDRDNALMMAHVRSTERTRGSSWRARV